MTHYDIVIRGGEVVDPSAVRTGLFDIALIGDSIAAVESVIDSSNAKVVIDATGQYVTPGLIDLHTHVYWGSTYWGIEPDPVAANTGVTTWLDVGSAGSYSFPAFRRYVVEASQSRVYSLLNLSSIGLIGPTWEFANLSYCDVDLARTMVDFNRDVIIGIKARIDHMTTRGTGIKPLQLARELADAVSLPLMVHVGVGPPHLEEVAEYMRPGDILTHCFTGHNMKIVDDKGKILPYIKVLREQGVVLDIGHGAGSFSFTTAEQMLAEGELPDVISTDIHQLAIQGPMFDMPTTLSKFLALGMSLPEVIACATAKPAAAMRKPELGSLNVGGNADIAIFQIEEGDFTFQDITMDERKGSRRLVNTATIVRGNLMERKPYPDLMPWAVLPERQRTKMIPLVPVPAKPAAPLLDNR